MEKVQITQYLSLLTDEKVILDLLSLINGTFKPLIAP